MRLLYLSVHSILEYDELKIFEELGINYFSLGSYLNPQQPIDPIRPPLKHSPDPWLVTHTPDRRNIPQEFIDRFDVIIVMHGDTPDGNWIIDNWERFKGKRVIWRTIGQSTSKLEKKLFNYRMDGLEVVRYSKREANIEDNIGCDKVIHFYKDPNEFYGWVGGGTEVIAFAQNMKHRADYCNYQAFLYLVNGYNAHVYGPNNESSGNLSGGFLTYDQMKQKLRDGRVYVYTGTQPACYTLSFIEAWMTGIPIVAVGPKYGNGLNLTGSMYEIQDFIQNGVNGFVSDDLDELRGRIEFLRRDIKSSRRIGAMGRDSAIKLFGKENIKNQWKEFLNL